MKKLLISIFIIASISIFSAPKATKAFSSFGTKSPDDTKTTIGKPIIRKPTGKFWETVATYDNRLPDDIVYRERYPKAKPEYLDYVFVRAEIGQLYQEPDLDAKILKDYPYLKKLKALERVYSRMNFWYLVEDDEGNKGYVLEPVIRKRIFRFDKALDKINELQNFIDTETEKGREIVSASSYSPNPSNKNPKTKKDKYGTVWEQNTVGHTSSGEIIYVPDRSIMSIISKESGKVKVDVASIKEDVTIPEGNITRNQRVTKNFRKVVAIDIENQNTMLFERNSQGVWEVISFVYSKTGIESSLGYETPKGFFTVAILKYVMGYTDGLGRQEGNARFAMRFSGGGYMHGTPVAADEESKREFVMSQRNKFLGIYTGTRKCVRTTEPHARFMFEWMCSNPKGGNEQNPSEPVVFIVF